MCFTLAPPRSAAPQPMPPPLLRLVREWVDLQREEVELRAEIARRYRSCDVVLRVALEDAYTDLVARRKRVESRLRAVSVELHQEV